MAGSVICTTGSPPACFHVNCRSRSASLTALLMPLSTLSSGNGSSPARRANPQRQHAGLGHVGRDRKAQDASQTVLLILAGQDDPLGPDRHAGTGQGRRQGLGEFLRQLDGQPAVEFLRRKHRSASAPTSARRRSGPGPVAPSGRRPSLARPRRLPVPGDRTRDVLCGLIEGKQSCRDQHQQAAEQPQGEAKFSCSPSVLLGVDEEIPEGLSPLV